jgi:hypothetical protein
MTANATSKKPYQTGLARKNRLKAKSKEWHFD